MSPYLGIPVRLSAQKMLNQGKGWLRILGLAKWLRSGGLYPIWKRWHPRQSHEHLLCKTKPSWQDWRTQHPSSKMPNNPTVSYNQVYQALHHCRSCVPENPDISPGQLAIQGLNSSQGNSNMPRGYFRSIWSWNALASRMTKTGRGDLIFLAKEQHFALRGQSNITSVNSSVYIPSARTNDPVPSRN